MVIHSGISVLIGVGLLSYAASKAVQTRRASYVVWACSGLMLLLKGITGRAEFVWPFVGGIVATIVLQWYERRPMTPQRIMSQIQAELERDRRRAARRRDSL